jgi:hypothetical protein
MKAIISLLVALFVSVSLGAQETDTIQDVKKSDTTNFTIGKKEISIIDKDGETDIKVRNRDGQKKENDNGDVSEDTSDSEVDIDDEDDNDWWNDEKSKRKDRRFKGHWNAFQIGINSYLSADKTTSLPASMDYMDLNTNKSINVNINMFQQSFALVGRSFGVISGLGLEFTNYVFDGNNTIIKNDAGIIVPDIKPFKLDKSKLTTSYLTVPLLLEFQFPGERRSNRLYINGGVVGGVKLGSRTKIKYKENGDKQDEKDRNDFNLNSLRYGFTGKIGIKHLSIYGTYYPVMLFEKNKGPELYPFMVGFSFDGF